MVRITKQERELLGKNGLDRSYLMDNDQGWCCRFVKEGVRMIALNPEFTPDFVNDLECSCHAD